MKKTVFTALLVFVFMGIMAGCKPEDKLPETKKETEITAESDSAASSAEEKNTTETAETETREKNIVTTDVNFRKGPGTEFESMHVLAAGTEVEILSRENGWVRVSCGDEEGYIYGEYLKTGEAEKETVVSSAETVQPVTEAETETEAETPAETEPSSEDTTEPETAPGGNNGILADNGRFDCAALPNTSIPYGNDWEDKDEKGLASGVHYYESLYGKYDPVFYIDTDEKVLYLTLDEGYEAGYTPRILDTLKEKNVKAVFFLTKQFLDSDPELIQRMIDEGHILGNHTCNHPNGGYPRTVDEKGLDYFTADVSLLHQLIYDRFGYDMKLFRFPEGEFSEQLLAKADNLGYTSVFWSYAHYDFNENEQPDPAVTLQRCLSHMAPGAVYLLHAKSSSNTEALGAFIDQARAEGYEFGVFPVNE